MRILVVEDERLIARFIIKGLSARGHETDHAYTGEEALARITAERPYDVMVLDLGLPDMDGLEVLSHLRRRGAELPVIVLTARAHDREESLRRGAAEYLVKPLAFDRLLASIEAVAA